MYRVFALGAVVLAASLAGARANPARAEQPSLASVLIVGDSVATGMSWHPDAIAVMQRNLDVDWQVAVCRRLTGASCWDQGVQPETAVGLVDSFQATQASAKCIELINALLMNASARKRSLVGGGTGHDDQ